MVRAFQVLVAALGLFLLLATLAPLARTGEWWVRILDFPRQQIALLLFVVVLVWLGTGPRSTASWGFAAALALAGSYQVSRMLPYTPVGRVEIEAVSCSDEHRLRIMVANVLMENRNAEGLLRIVRDARPDVLLVAEGDDWWDRQLAVLDAEYPNALKRPLDNKYGMHLFSRLPLRDAEIRVLVEEDIPSVRASVRLRSGQWVDFHGLHPRPPKPGSDTEPRDAELLIAGREVREAGRPAVVAGDMNDVAWSSTTKHFQRIAEVLDPRRGRGTFNTFSALLPWPLRWPLDHVFATKHFGLSELRLLPHFNSDHLPVLVELCHRPDLAARQQPERADADDHERARETIRDGRAEER